MKLKTRWGVAIATLLGIGGCMLGGQNPPPEDMDKHLSKPAKTLVKKAFTFENLTATKIETDVITLADYHVHIVAHGTHHNSRDAYLNSNLSTWHHPINKIKTLFLMDAAHVSDFDKADTQYKKRLLDLMLHFKQAQQTYAPPSMPPTNVHFYLYALDYYHNEDGNPVKAHTELYIPNEYVIELAQSFNQKQKLPAAENEKNSHGTIRIIPVASVHPYRKDFKQQLSALKKQGVQFIKWLPPAMNIDLEKVKKENYLAMAEHKMTLLTHTGKEHALYTSRENQILGDPHKLRTALDCGVNVVALHNGRDGTDAETGVSYFQHFLELMGEKKYNGRLFGEVSAMTLGPVFFLPGSQEKLNEVIRAAQPSGILYQRVLNGSDYPLPAVPMLNPTRKLVQRKMLTADERQQLNEIFIYNPLLFDFVLKRTIKNTVSGTAIKLPDLVFLETDFYQTPLPAIAAGCQTL